MTEVANELMYELLKRIRGDVSGLREGQLSLSQEMASSKSQIYITHGDFNNLRNTVSQVEIRLDSIENRLDLREFAEAQARFESHP